MSAHKLIVAAFACGAAAIICQAALAATKDLGGGFSDHGVATPISCSRGLVCTADGQGRDIILIWLMDHRGVYELLCIDAEKGGAREFPVPFRWGGDSPYASILSSANKYYAHYGSHFIEFDPAQLKFTFWQKTSSGTAMSMTEDDQGRIWSATYPNCGLACFDPKARKLTDYGYINKENWRQYPRAIATDDAGWVYVGVGITKAHLIAFDPATAKAKPLISEGERTHGTPRLLRDVNGKVYARLPNGTWYELYRGQARRLDSAPKIRAKRYIAGSQGLWHRFFPDGKRLVSLDLARRVAIIEDPKTRQRREIRFDYRSEGAHIMAVAAAPNNTICGGTAFPFYFFSYDPATDKWINQPCYGQWNTVARQGDRFFVGGYGGGFLLEWNPFAPWKPTQPGDETCNPRLLAMAKPDINRPHDLLAMPDGRTLILAGTPAYGLTGGGLLIWDRRTGQHMLLKHTDLIKWHSTMSLAALPNGLVVGGTTVAAGTGGERKADQAELYILNPRTGRLIWHGRALEGVYGYTDLCLGRRGFVYGFADSTRFFVFDPKYRRIIRVTDISKTLGPTSGGQGPRVFVKTPGGDIYVLLRRGIAKLDEATFRLSMVAKSPVSIGVGGAYLNGRVYFASGSHLYSYKLGQ